MEELSVYKDAVAVAQEICDAKAEIPIEAEVLIPDYLPPVLKLVKCLVLPIVLQKQLSAARLSVEGYLRVVLYYQSDADMALCQAEHKVPFTKQLECRTGEYACPDIHVCGEMEYVNCRAVNERRVDVRGAYALCVHAEAQAQQEVITALSGCGAEMKTCTLVGESVQTVLEKIVTAENTVSFEKIPEMVLHIDCAYEVQETRIVAEKAVCKGTIVARIVYRNGAENAVQTKEAQIPFQEVLDAGGADDICTAKEELCTVSCALSADETGAVTLAVTFALTVRVFRPVECLAASDAFSTQCEMELTKANLLLDTTMETFALQTEATAQGVLPDDKAQVVDVLTTVFAPELQDTESGKTLQGRVLVHMICANALGELACYDNPCEYSCSLPEQEPSAMVRVAAYAQVSSVSVRRAGGQVTAAVLLRVSGTMVCRRHYEALTEAVCTKERERPAKDYLRIYYAQPGEALFDIAKRYAVSPDAIKAANALDEAPLMQSCRLLIPSPVPQGGN